MDSKRLKILENILNKIYSGTDFRLSKRKKRKNATEKIKGMYAPNLKAIRETPIRDTQTILTQLELGKELGLSKDTIAGIEQGTEKLAFYNAIKISYLYNVSLDYIYGLTDIPREETRLANEIRNILKVGDVKDLTKCGQDGVWNNNQQLFLTIDKDVLEYLLEYRQLEYNKYYEKISDTEYKLLKSKIDTKYDKSFNKTNETYKKMGYGNRTFILIDMQEFNRRQSDNEYLSSLISIPLENNERYLEINEQVSKINLKKEKQ